MPSRPHTSQAASANRPAPSPCTKTLHTAAEHDTASGTRIIRESTSPRLCSPPDYARRPEVQRAVTSAAAPLPPPEPSPANAMNGYTHGAHSNGADPSRGSDGAGGQYPPIAEIAASASETVEGLKHHSVRKHVLHSAQQPLTSPRSSISWSKADTASTTQR